jgi:hypothetical protein
MLLPTKYQKVNLNVLLLLMVYLFIHVSNLFFVQQNTAVKSKHHSFIFKRKIKSFFKVQKSEKTTVNQTRLSLQRLIQNAAKFFVLLLFGAVVLTGVSKLFPSPNQYLPDYRHAYLQCCVIRI